jgi:cellulose synthase/poly-beta-1,6-N-acetylglucosamine synthase-like glycosyltransferase
VETLLDLTGRPPVHVVDDESSDGTAALAAALAAGEPRLTVASAGPLPAGWRGKVHGLWKGAQAIHSPWLLLTDADVRHQPPGLERALAAAACWRLDAVSLTGYQAAHGLGENLLVPGVFAVLDALIGDWQQAADGGGPAVATGQFLLLRRAAWEDCGGFRAVRGEALDDVAIARTLRRHGYRTGFFRTPHLLTVRMYQGWRAAARGWRRNLGSLFGPRLGTALGALVVLALPPCVLVALLIRAMTAGEGGGGAAATGAALLWLAGAATSGLLRVGSGHRPAYALLYPLDALIVAAVVAAAVRDFRRGQLASWKGRELRL